VPHETTTITWLNDLGQDGARLVAGDGRQNVATGDGVQRGVVVVIHKRGRFLMIRRAAGVPAGGAWCFVGGAIEPGETEPEAVVREFAEEVGGRARPLRKIWEYMRQDRKLLLYWWLAEMDGGVLKPNRAEVAEIRWCSPEEVETLPGVLESNSHFMRAVGGALIRGDLAS
jgi:8-oxo-dGTP diphosphatase